MRLNISARLLSLIVALVATLSVIVGALDQLDVGYVGIPLNAAHKFSNRLAQFEIERAESDRFDIALLGDSTAGNFASESSIPHQLQLAANRRLDAGSQVRVANLSSPGMGPYDFYFMSDLLVQSRPDAVVVLLNLSTFSDSWTKAFRRPELAGWIPWGRFADATRLPLHRVGVTTDQLLVDMSLAGFGLLVPWRWVRLEQARIFHGKVVLEKHLDAEMGAGHQSQFHRDRLRHFSDLYNYRNNKRLSAIGVEDRFGAALTGIAPDQSDLEMLEALLGVFREAEIPVLVYANPANIESFREVGALDEDGLAKTLAVLESRVEAAGAHWVDLHALFSDDHFRDPGGHFKHRDPDATPILGAALAKALIEASPNLQVRPVLEAWD